MEHVYKHFLHRARSQPIGLFAATGLRVIAVQNPLTSRATVELTMN